MLGLTKAGEQFAGRWRLSISRAGCFRCRVARDGSGCLRPINPCCFDLWRCFAMKGVRTFLFERILRKGPAGRRQLKPEEVGGIVFSELRFVQTRNVRRVNDC